MTQYNFNIVYFVVSILHLVIKTHYLALKMVNWVIVNLHYVFIQYFLKQLHPSRCDRFAEMRWRSVASLLSAAIKRLHAFPLIRRDPNQRGSSDTPDNKQERDSWYFGSCWSIVLGSPRSKKALTRRLIPGTKDETESPSSRRWSFWY